MVRLKSIARASVLLLTFHIASQSHSQECQPGWAAGEFCIPGSDSVPSTSYSYDFGDGERLYISGTFDTIGCNVGFNRIAMWDGFEWSPLAGTIGIGLNNQPKDMIAFDDGSGTALFVAGTFTMAGGITVNGVAKWDGNDWHALSGPSGTGVNNYANSLEVYDDGSGPALYVGGNFTAAGGYPASNLAKWDGTDWTPISDPLLGPIAQEIYTLKVFDGKLYIGGNFRFINGEEFNRIASWDGFQLGKLTGSLGTGVGNAVNALEVFDPGDGPKLLVGGLFSSGGGFSASGLVCWNGTDWYNCRQGSGVGRVNDIAIEVDENGSQVAYIAMSSGSHDYIVKWDGVNWQDLTGPSDTGTSEPVSTVTAFNDGSSSKIFIGGNFRKAGGIDVRYMAVWDGNSIGIMPGTGSSILDSVVETSTTFDDGNGEKLYVGGRFQFVNAYGQFVQYLTRYENGHWVRLSGGALSSGFPPVRCMESFDDGTGTQLYVGGSFNTAGEMTVNNIARWNGTEWSPLTGPSGTGTNGVVYTIAQYDDGSGPAIYIGGQFTSVGGITANNIAKWNGAEWEALATSQGNGTDSIVYCLMGYDDGSGMSLFVGGGFSTAGGIPARYIARWYGNDWHAMPSSDFNGTVYAFEQFDDGNGLDMYAGGFFTSVGGQTVNRIARWNGSAWSALQSTFGVGFNDAVLDLRSFDDGTGNALFACGRFERNGSQDVNYIAKWDGKEWNPLLEGTAIGLESQATRMTDFNNGNGLGLYVTGGFDAAGPHATNRIALWSSCSQNICLPDTNHDGILSPADFSAWVAAYNSQSPKCDQNGDGSCTPADFSSWVLNYNTGCP